MTVSGNTDSNTTSALGDVMMSAVDNILDSDISGTGNVSLSDLGSLVTNFN